MSVRTILVAIIVELGTTMNNFLLSKNVLSFLYIYIYVSITWLKKKKNWRDSEGFENEYDRDWTKKKGRGREEEGLQALNIWWNIFFHRENDLSPHLHAIFEAVFGSLNHDSRD